MNASIATSIGDEASSGKALLISRCFSACMMHRKAVAFIIDFEKRMRIVAVPAAAGRKAVHSSGVVLLEARADARAGRSGGALPPAHGRTLGRRPRDGAMRSFPTPVSTGSGSKGLSQPRPGSAPAVPPLRCGLHHIGRVGADSRSRAPVQAPRPQPGTRPHTLRTGTRG